MKYVLTFALLASAAALTACASSGSRSMESKPVRIATMSSASDAIAPGDCAEARRRAAAKPDLTVDRIPAPVSMKPAPLRGYPAKALRKDGSAEVKVDVIVDTLGRANMKTFKVVASSHPWFANNVRGVIGKWRFTPAELAGCKVPRVYHFMASLPPRGKRGK
jgi:outer membrane biosynthesis protein TonB